MWGGGLTAHFELRGTCCLVAGRWGLSLIGRRSPVFTSVTLPTRVNVIPNPSLETQRTVLPSDPFSSMFRPHPIVGRWPKPIGIPCVPLCQEWMRLTGHLHSVHNSPNPCGLSKKCNLSSAKAASWFSVPSIVTPGVVTVAHFPPATR